MSPDWDIFDEARRQNPDLLTDFRNPSQRRSQLPVVYRRSQLPAVQGSDSNLVAPATKHPIPSALLADAVAVLAVVASLGIDLQIPPVPRAEPITLHPPIHWSGRISVHPIGHGGRILHSAAGHIDLSAVT